VSFAVNYTNTVSTQRRFSYLVQHGFILIYCGFACTVHEEETLINEYFYPFYMYFGSSIWHEFELIGHVKCYFMPFHDVFQTENVLL